MSNNNRFHLLYLHGPQDIADITVHTFFCIHLFTSPSGERKHSQLVLESKKQNNTVLKLDTFKEEQLNSLREIQGNLDIIHFQGCPVSQTSGVAAALSHRLNTCSQTMDSASGFQVETHHKEKELHILTPFYETGLTLAFSD